MERIKLWRSNRKRLIGDVVLDGEDLHIDVSDERERTRLEEVFGQTGEVTWGYVWYGEGDMKETQAKPASPEWLWFVVANILYPMGYQADFGVTENSA